MKIAVIQLWSADSGEGGKQIVEGVRQHEQAGMAFKIDAASRRNCRVLDSRSYAVSEW